MIRIQCKNLPIHVALIPWTEKEKSFVVLYGHAGCESPLFCETVADEVQLGMRSENSSDVERVLEMPDLSHLRERHPMSLSGGQKQRVAIASAILAGKEILIFDEPTSGLDFRHMEQTAALLSSLKGKQTVLIVTHDPELIQRCCDHIVCIENGTVI